MTKITVVPELVKFYQSYWDWVNKGAPDLEPFARNLGLCSNLCYCVYSFYACQDIKKAMKLQFTEAGLNRTFPFGEEEYDMHGMDETMHKDPNRLAWVRARLQDAGIDV